MGIVFGGVVVVVVGGFVVVRLIVFVLVVVLVVVIVLTKANMFGPSRFFSRSPFACKGSES